MGQKSVIIVLGLVLYLLSAGASYAAFSYLHPILPGQNSVVENPQNTSTDSKKANGKFVVPKNPYANLPKTEECPLNGSMHSKPEKDNWDKRRPLGVMIENSTPARPQSGLSQADVVYEAVAEGGITRFLAIYFCQDSEHVGPVRSARTYFMDWLSEYGSSPLYAHVGGANTPGPADALGQIDRYGWGSFNDLNQFSVGFPTYARDPERLPGVALEHTMYSSTQKLWNFAATKRALTNVETDDTTGKQIPWTTGFVPWTFKDDAPIGSRPTSFAATFNFSGTQASYIDDYAVKWQYDHDSNAYLRFNGGKPHQDFNTNQQILAKNVIIQFMDMTVADDGYDEEGHGQHTLYVDKGTGKAKFLLDGIMTDGTWAKKTRLDRTRFYAANGQELKLNKGLTWVETLPIGQQVVVGSN